MNATDLLAGLRLSDHAERTYTLGEIADEIAHSPDALRTWFNGGGLALAPPLDVVADKGGRGLSHRLHWRTVVMLLLALKLQQFGFGQSNGEAAEIAGSVFAAGLGLSHLCTTESPLISVKREPEGAIRTALVFRDALACEIENPMSRDGLAGIGTLLIDPLGLGRVLWRMAMAQARREAAEEPDAEADASIAGADGGSCGA